MSSWLSTLTSPFRGSSGLSDYPKFISAEEAKGIDEQLMGEEGAFSIDQVRSLSSRLLRSDHADIRSMCSLWN